MRTIEFVVTERSGLHALPATVIVEKLNKYESEVYASFGGNIVNAKSIFGLVSLGAKQGDVVIFEIHGSDENQVQI